MAVFGCTININTNKHLSMTHIVFGINLSCCVPKQALHNFFVATFNSTMQSSLTILYMVRVAIHNVHVNIMYKSWICKLTTCILQMRNQRFFMLCMMGTCYCTSQDIQVHRDGAAVVLYSNYTVIVIILSTVCNSNTLEDHVHITTYIIKAHTCWCLSGV